MRAYRFDALTSLDNLSRHEEPMPQPQRGEILLRVHAVSLNYRDIAMPLGKYPQPASPGLVPTSDAASEVVEVGEGVDGFNVGDRVINIFHPRWYGGPMPADWASTGYGSGQDGWLTEYKVVSQEELVHLPDGVSWEEAATLPCAAVTAWNGLVGKAPLQAGHNVLTLGTGGVAIFAVQLAKVLGARVIATTSSAQKAERLRALGADEVINYSEVKDWGAKARELTGGRGVDRVIEVGGSATIGQSLKAVRQDGQIALIGFLGTDNPGIDYFALFGSGAAVQGIFVGSRPDLENLVRVVRASKLKPVIDKVFGFDEAKAAFEHLRDGGAVGKTVIQVAN